MVSFAQWELSYFCFVLLRVIISFVTCILASITLWHAHNCLEYGLSGGTIIMTPNRYKNRTCRKYVTFNHEKGICTLQWRPMRPRLLKPPTYRVLFSTLFMLTTKETHLSTAFMTGCLWRESTDDRWFASQKAGYAENVFISWWFAYIICHLPFRRQDLKHSDKCLWYFWSGLPPTVWLGLTPRNLPTWMKNKSVYILHEVYKSLNKCVNFLIIGNVTLVEITGTNILMPYS